MRSFIMINHTVMKVLLRGRSLSIPQVAVLADVSINTVRTYIRSGALPAKLRGRAYLIDIAEAVRFRRQRVRHKRATTSVI